MERLTYDFCIGGRHCWQVKGADNLTCAEVCKDQDDNGNGCDTCPISKAFDRLAAYEDTGLTPEEIMALLNPPNPPLTLDEIRQMRGKPVWCPEAEAYGIIKLDKIGAWADKPFLKFFWLQDEDSPCGVDCEWDIEKRNLTLYRRKPEVSQ